MPSQSLRSEDQSRTESREPGSKRMIDVEFDERKLVKFEVGSSIGPLAEEKCRIVLNV